MNNGGENTDEENIFYFESDHLALRGNKDYSNVLCTLAVLEAQRVRAHEQLEELVEAKKRYLSNPDLLLEKLRNNEPIIAPNQMTIAKIPEIENYELLPPSTENVKIKEEPAAGEELSSVRGRILDESKPETFNRLWSCEEQRRLEDLLIEYPVEAVEMRRFAKIAKALGNRTPLQVASRVQKYFQKLYEAGLPIPGRIPKNRRNHLKTKHIYRPSTFFPAHNVTVHMPEDDYLMGDLSNMHDRAGIYTSDTTDANWMHEAQRPEVKQRMLHILKVIRNEKHEFPDGYNPDPMAAKCALCQIADVSRTHWRCNTCYCSISYCSDCFVSQLISRKFEHLTHDVVQQNDE